MSLTAWLRRFHISKTVRKSEETTFVIDHFKEQRTRTISDELTKRTDRWPDIFQTKGLIILRAYRFTAKFTKTMRENFRAHATLLLSYASEKIFVHVTG